MSLVRKGRILEMLRRLRRQDLDSDWMCCLKESSESRTTPRTLACGDGLIVVPSILTERSGEGAYGGGKIISSVLDRLSLRKWCDIQTDISDSKLMIREETEVVS